MSISAAIVLCYILNIDNIQPCDFYINADGSVSVTGASLNSFVVNSKGGIIRALKGIFTGKKQFMGELGDCLRSLTIPIDIVKKLNNRRSIAKLEESEGYIQIVNSRTSKLQESITVMKAVAYTSTRGYLSSLQVSHEIVNAFMVMADSGIFELEKKMKSSIYVNDGNKVNKEWSSYR
jgi:hypothetical protein